MKHWQETGRVVDRILELGREGRRCALATVTRIEGSAYRRPGAKLLIEESGAVLGGVSGGCLEEDVRLAGLEAMASGRPRSLHYDTGRDEARIWGIDLGCDGQVDLFVQPIPAEAAAGPWTRVRELIEGDAPFAVATTVEAADATPGGQIVVDEASFQAGRPAGDGDAGVEAAARAALRAGRARLQVVGSRRVFIEVLSPPPTLLVCGAGDDARPLVAFAAGVGFRTVVVDHRSAFLVAQRFPQARRLLLLRADEASPALRADSSTYAVVMSHSFETDKAWVGRLIGTDAAYVGVLGPRARTRRIVADLGVEHDERVFGPVGLDLGADGPEQVALSVVAELLALRSRRAPRHLREREVALHAHR
jgi:xanthine/CO dehydrogenase XdhC/CoxF family maturation factor